MIRLTFDNSRISINKPVMMYRRAAHAQRIAMMCRALGAGVRQTRPREGAEMPAGVQWRPTAILVPAPQ
eukprot:SAG31_NODE_2277_length_6027_cov_4.019062_1_plen_69_part_00